MNTTEGVRRITRSIRGLGILACVVTFLGQLADGASLSSMGMWLAVAGTFAAFCYALAWIIDGFVAPKG